MEQQVVDLLEYLKAEQGRSPNTIAAYRNDLMQFVEFLQIHHKPPVESWSAVDGVLLERYLGFLKTQTKPYSSATIARKLAAVKRFCEFLYTSGWLEQNVSKTVRLPKVAKNLPHTMHTDDLHKLLAAPEAQHSPQSLRDKALLETLYATGMRVSELVDLNVADVDLAAEQIRCNVGGRHCRLVHIGDGAAAALALYLQEGREQLVMNRSESALFLNHRGQRLTRQGLWLIIKRYVKQAGIKTPVTPHTLRHSFAAHLVNAGAALRDIKERLGYAHLSSTQIYQQVTNGATSELVIDGHPMATVNGKH